MQQKFDGEFLKKFCAVGISYYRLNKPFSDKDYSYASNGHMIIRVKRIAEIDDLVPEMVKTDLLFRNMDRTKHNDFPEYKAPERRKCKSCRGAGKAQVCYECEGEGVVELQSSHNEYEVECKTCNGSGGIPGGNENCDVCNGTGMEYVNSWEYVDFGPSGLRIKLLDKIKDLPGIKIGGMSDDHMVDFSFDGGDGVMMGMSKD